MATIKAYSVAQTEKQYGGTAVQSDVYSLSSGVPGAGRTGRNGAYDHPTASGLQEGRVETLLNGSRTAAADPVASLAISTNASGPIEVRNTDVVATTTTITGSGAGCIVTFTSTDADPTQLAALTISEGGEGYSSGDTLEVDGYPGSVVTVTV